MARVTNVECDRCKKVGRDSEFDSIRLDGSYFDVCNSCHTKIVKALEESGLAPWLAPEFMAENRIGPSKKGIPDA